MHSPRHALWLEPSAPAASRAHGYGSTERRRGLHRFRHPGMMLAAQMLPVRDAVRLENPDLIFQFAQFEVPPSPHRPMQVTLAV